MGISLQLKLGCQRYHKPTELPEMAALGRSSAELRARSLKSLQLSDVAKMAGAYLHIESLPSELINNYFN